MSLIRAMALGGDLNAVPVETVEPAGELVACRLNASDATIEIRMWIPAALDILRVPRPVIGGMDEYRRTDLRTADGATIYEVRRVSQPSSQNSYCTTDA